MKITTGLVKILTIPKRIKIIKGGTYAGKTYNIITILINEMCKKHNPPLRATVVAESIPAIKQGALHIFMEQMRMINYWKENQYNATDRIYTFSNGNKIQFTAYDKAGKAKAAGKRNILFINEIDNVPKDVCIELISRTDGDVYVDYNPVTEFWVDTELSKLPDACSLTLTYRDNEALPSAKIQELEYKRILAHTSAYWRNWCDVYLDGKQGKLQNACIDNYEIIDSIPAGAKLIAAGLDFGFHPDPNACVLIYQYNDAIIADEYIYQTNMSLSELINKLKGIKVRVIADRSQPLLIQELKRSGIYATAYTSGKDGVVAGIAKINEKKLFITSRSLNLIRELRGYVWVDGYPSGEDHAIDAMRYAITYEVKTLKSQII